tara:strand:- start:791 stop:2608 length:1818 start_codon:yes stop_codon:yes gene_type:complete
MVREAQKKTLNVGGFVEPSKEAASKAVKAKRIAGKQIFYGGLEAEKRRRLSEEVKQFNRDFGGDPAVDKFNPKGTGMGDRFDPTAKNFFSPSKFGSEVAKVASSDVSNLNVGNNANEAVGIVNQSTANLVDASYDSTYKQEKSPGYEDSYKQIKQIFDKPKEDDFKTTVEKRFSKSMYGGEGISEEQAIDTFRRKNLDYESGTDFFGDKVDYSTETIKRYMATDAKEKYEKDQAFKRTQQLNEARKIAAQERKKIDDQAYFRANQKFDEPSITQKVSNFVFGTDLKGKPDPRNKNLVTKDERISMLQGTERAYNVPGISVDQYGNLSVPYDKINPDTKFKTRTPASQLTGEDFKAKEDIERRKIFREQAGLSPNPNLMERTTKFLGDVIGGVSRIFTPAAQAGGMPSADSLANTFTSGQSLGGLSGLPSSMGDNISAGISGMRGNIGAAVEAGGMGGLNRGGSGDPRSSGRTVTIGGRTFRQSKYGRPQPRVQSPMEAGMGPGAKRARNIADANNQGGGVARGKSAARSKAQAAAKARKAAGQTVAGVNARNRARMRRRARNRSRGRGRSMCDLRFKFNIMPLTNMHLLRDDLAEVAYFVKELQA